MNDRGSATIATITLLPLLMAIAAVFFASYLLLLADSEARHVCRTELLHAQALISRHLEQLFALNPRAHSLRLQRRTAEAKVAATLGTPAHLAAQAELQAVIQAQLALALAQKKLINLARLHARTAPALTLAKIHRTLRARRALVRADTKPDDWRSSQRIPRIDLRKKPAGSLTPDYEPGVNFNVSQEMRVSWSFGVDSLLPSWLKPFGRFHGLRVNAECSATLIQEKNKWRPQLTKEGKRLSNFSLRSLF